MPNEERVNVLRAPLEQVADVFAQHAPKMGEIGATNLGRTFERLSRTIRAIIGEADFNRSMELDRFAADNDDRQRGD